MQKEARLECEDQEQPGDMMRIQHQQGYNSDDDFEMKSENVEWVGQGKHERGRTFYTGVNVDGLQLCQWDSVLVETQPGGKYKVAIIAQLFDGPFGASAHIQWLSSAQNTLLGEMADQRQLFYTDDCKTVALAKIWDRCTVERRIVPQHEELGANFWVWHWHDGDTRFEEREPPVRIDKDLSFCEVCDRRAAKEAWKKPKLLKDRKTIRWRGQTLRPGDGVLLPRGTIDLPGSSVDNSEIANKLPEVKDRVDNDIYTEHYRKKNSGEQNYKQPQLKPLQVGQIQEITEKKKTKSIMLKVRLFYRLGECSMIIDHVRMYVNSRFSEDIDADLDFALQYTAEKSPHSLYGSSEETTVDFNEVRDACFLKFFPSSTDLEVIENWCEEGPNRFFFQKVSPVPLHVIPPLFSGLMQATGS